MSRNDLMFYLKNRGLDMDLKAPGTRSFETQAYEEIERLDIVEQRARALLARLDEISAHPSYRSQVDIAYVHGHRYTGPSFDVVANELRQVLRPADRDSPQRKVTND